MSDFSKAIAPFHGKSHGSWERWKSMLEFLFIAEKVTDPAIKHAKLLLLGGPEIQDLFHSLPKVTVYPEGKDIYSYTVDCFDAKLGCKNTKWYERYILARLVQNNEENFSSFVTRIRTQALKCEYATKAQREEAVQLQIITGCQSAALRTELMRTKAEADLEAFEDLGCTFEAVTMQAGAIASPSVNSTSSSSAATPQPDSTKVCKTEERKRKGGGNPRKKEWHWKSKGSDNGGSGKQVPCFCCGHSDHVAKDPKCPAKKATCSKCKRVGHFAKVCRSRKVDSNDDSAPAAKNVPVKSVVTEEKIFCVREGIDSSGGEETVSCSFGGVEQKMFIDSGSLYSIVSFNQFRKIRRSSNFKAIQYLPNPKVNFVDGAGEVRYTVRFTVLVEIMCDGNRREAEVVVVNEEMPMLLGRQDAKALGVLKVGIGACSNERINAVSTAKLAPLSKLKNYQLCIPIDENVTPVIQPMYRVPWGLRASVEDCVNELLALDVIEPVTGPSKWVSPIVLEPKSDGSYRLCVNMRQPNLAVRRQNHPMPMFEDFEPLLQEAGYFSKVDLLQAYHQIELEPSSREITTFSTHLGLFRFKRLGEGINCAAEKFQFILESILAGLEGVVNYLDDILVFARSKEEHDARLAALLEKLRENDLTINEKKCQFNKTEVTFLGHIVGHGVIKPMLNKVRVIEEFRLPKSDEELRSFLGLVSYVGKFVPHLSTELDSLRETARTKPFQWSAEAVQQFAHVQSLLSDESYLYMFDPELHTIVMADASPVGIGAVLLQKKGEETRVICYVSRTLTAVERRYSQTEKEALALVFAVERLKYYLLGRSFDLVTDHKPLETLFGPTSKPCARIERWVMRLQCYDYKVRYAPGKNNIADPLSRLLVVDDNIQTVNSSVYEKNLVMFVQHLVPRAVTLPDIRKATETDDELRSLVELLSENREIKVKPYSALSQELCVVDGILLRGNRIVIPSSLRKLVLENAHQGHPGICKMKERLRCKVWWPGIDSMADRAVRSCDSCQKVGKSITIEQMSRRKLPDGPWQDVAIDFKSLTASKQYLCVVVDYFSRYIETEIMTEITSESTVRFLSEIFARHGIPYSITSDNGTQFSSKEFQEFCKVSGIVHYTTPPYWPMANGEVERQNRSLQKILQIAHLNNENIGVALLDYLLMYRSTPHSVTGKSPAELLFHRKIRDKLPTLRERVEEQGVRDADAYNKGAESIKLLSIVVPPYRLRGDQAILECNYELERDSLYAVKWYKENEEFFRYVPKSQPPLFSYKLEGVKVDHENSNGTRVTLKSVNLRSSGTYRCEVSAEAPSFSSAQQEARMEVVFLPRNGPQITGERLEYQIGDELNLNCTSGKSYPPSLLRWYVNEKPVKEKDLIHYSTHTFSHGLATSILGLRLTILSDHFIDDGSMKVRCVAYVTPLLWQGDRESVLQKIDKREALLLVKSSRAVANRLDRTIILPILSYMLCLTLAL